MKFQTERPLVGQFVTLWKFNGKLCCSMNKINEEGKVLEYSDWVSNWLPENELSDKCSDFIYAVLDDENG